MRRKSRKEAVYLAAGMLLVMSLACNFPTQPKPATSTPETQAVTVTATASQPTPSPTEEVARPTGTSSSPGDAAGKPPLPVESDIFASVSVRGGNGSYQGKISFPGSDSSDEVYIKPVGFDSTLTSGSLVFTLICSGDGNAKVNYKGGAVKSGSPGCGSLWTVAVVNGGADSHITIRLDDRGEVVWTLSVTSGQ